MTDTSPTQEMLLVELVLELEMLKTMNETLKEYLEHVRSLKTNLGAIHINFKQLAGVNQSWIDSLQNK